MRSITAIQADIDSTEAAIQAGNVDQSQIDVWNMQIADFKIELQAEEAQQQTLQERVEQAKETGYLLDTLFSNDIPLIELSHTPENHELVAIAVQKAFLAQQDAFNAEVEKYQIIAHEKNTQYLIEKEINDDLNKGNIQMALDVTELNKKLRNAAAIIEEKDAEIKRLQEQKAAGEVILLAPLSAEEREFKLLSELMGNRAKVTNIRLKDTNGFDTRISLANNALTGEEIEFHTIYVKRYEEISEEAAEQLRTDYASKKAEIEAQNAVIPVAEPTIEPLNDVTELEAPKEEIPFHEEVQLVNQPSNSDREVAATEESEIVTLESLHERVKALELKVAA